MYLIPYTTLDTGFKIWMMVVESGAFCQSEIKTFQELKLTGCNSPTNLVNPMVCKKKYLSWLWGADRKKSSLEITV